MKIKKNIVNLFTSLIVAVSLPIESFSSVTTGDRFEVLTGDKILVSDVLKTHKADISVEGNTLVNMFNGFLSLTNNSDIYATYQNNELTLQPQSGFSESIAPNYLGTPNLRKSMVASYKYTLYFKCNIEGARFGIIGVDVDGNEVGSEYSIVTKKGTNKLTFTLDKNISSVKEFRFKLFDTANNNTHTFSDIVLLEGSYDYESLSYFDGLLSSGETNSNRITVSNKSQSDIDIFTDNINLFLNEPLRGLPNGNRDKIVEIDGELFIERNTKQIVIDGDTTTRFRYNYVGGSPIAAFHLSISGDDTKKGRDNMEVQCDTLPTSKVDYRSRKHNSIAIHPDTSSGLSGSIDVSLLETPDRAGLIKYFEENPATIVHAIKNPIYEPLNTSLKINLFEGENLVTSNSVIPVNISVSVDRLLNVAAQMVALAKENPTSENLSNARLWVNLIDDSTFKDELNDSLNTIINVEDIEIERKSASVNSDIYIKMKNTLSLSLDTNSIVFDDFDSTESMEKKNALNITVQSSLPYTLSASLESEIYNSDKSNKLDKSILNIKNSTDSNYRGFTDIGTPMVILENQVYNNVNNHSIDLMLNSTGFKKADTYKTTLKFEVEQK